MSRSEPGSRSASPHRPLPISTWFFPHFHAVFSKAPVDIDNGSYIRAEHSRRDGQNTFEPVPISKAVCCPALACIPERHHAQLGQVMAAGAEADDAGSISEYGASCNSQPSPPRGFDHKAASHQRFSHCFHPHSQSSPDGSRRFPVHSLPMRVFSSRVP